MAILGEGISLFYFMRIVIQRVTKAEVCVEGQCVGAIGHGLLLFLEWGVAMKNPMRIGW